MVDQETPARGMLAAGVIVLGVIGMATGQLIDALQPIEAGERLLAVVNGIVFTAAGAALLVPRLRPAGAIALIVLMGFGLATQAPGLLGAPGDVTLWVAAAETTAIAAAAWLVIAPADGRSRIAARLVVGAMLTLFGAIHLMYSEAIAGLMPAWIPGGTIWPMLTGAAQIAAGLAILSGVQGWLAAAGTGAMFASWLFLVHLPRIIADPSSRFEWTFMARDLALIGVVWILGVALAKRAVPSR